MKFWTSVADLRRPKKRTFFSVFNRSLIGSLLFFIITNFAVWINGGYSYTFSGLFDCYYMAIPFFKNTIAGDLCFNALLFSLFSFAEHKIQALRLAKSK